MREVNDLREIIDNARDVTRATFLRHVAPADMRRLEAECGYVPHPAQGLTMAADWHVQYCRSSLHRHRVWFFRWSAIEFVFVQPSTVLTTKGDQP